MTRIDRMARLLMTRAPFALLPAAAFAQVPAEQAQDKPTQTITEPVATDAPLGEIVVTALKRSQSLQRTPATVEVVSALQLQSSGIQTIEQLRSVAPGVIIQRPPNNTANASIRGLGTSPGPVSFDQAVALFVDGVYAARGADFLSSLFDVESIQVVKGSQTAVLGKNSSLGAIVLTTRKPGRELSANFLANYEFERRSTVVSGGIDIPVTSDFAIRVSAQYQDLGGFMKNRVTLAPAERTARQTDEQAVRVTGVWRPTSGITVTANYAHEFLRNTGIPADLIVGSPGLQTLFNLSGFGATYEVNQDNRYAARNDRGPSGIRQPSDRATATIDLDLGGAELTSVTGWSQFGQDRYIDNDYTPGSYYEDISNISGNQFSQELRIASPSRQRLKYLAGVLYLNNLLKQDQTQTTTYPGGIAGPVPVAGSYNATFRQRTETWSGFIQLGYDITDKLTITGAARLTNERKGVDMQRTTLVPGRFSTLVNPPYPLTRLSRSETVLDGSGTIQYQIGERAMIYASYGQGTKGGGYSDFPLPASAEYRKEVARTIEAGFKLEAEDRSWRLNAAGFHTTVDDFQNNFFNGQVFNVQNLDLVSDGAELEAFWEPVDDLKLNLAGTYAHSRNKDHAPGIGDRFPRSPRLSGKAGFDYSRDVASNITGYIGGDVTYRSSISHQVNPDAVPYGRPFPTLNGTLGIRSANGRWDLALIGRNIANEKSISFAAAVPFTPGAVLAIPEEPRTITVQLALKF